MAASKRYNTYLSGTVGDIVRCTKIVLFNKKKTLVVTVDGTKVALPYLSLTNLDELWSLLKRSEEREYVELDIDPDTGKFYTDSQPVRAIDGFYDIIYINSIDGTASGYTEFFSVQGQANIDGLLITLEFVSKIEDNLAVSINNTINRYSFTAQNFLGNNKPWEYTTREAIQSWLGELKGKAPYGTHLQTILSGNQAVFLDNGSGLTGEGEYYPAKFISNISLDPYEVGFDHFQIGYLWQSSASSADIVLYAWSGQKYRIISIVTSNKFGRPYEYTLNGKGYVELAGTSSEISYFSGRYAILSDGIIYDTIRGCSLKGLDYGRFYYLLNQEGCDNELIKIPLAASSNDPIDYFPEPITKSIYSPNYLNLLSRVVGDWYIYQETSQISVISGMRTAIRLKTGDLGRVLFVNSRVLWILSPDGLTVNMYFSSGLYCTEESMEDGAFKWKKYPDKVVTIDPASNPFSLSRNFSEWRRGSTPDTLDGFKFLNALGGFIFYTTTDKYLRYL